MIIKSLNQVKNDGPFNLGWKQTLDGFSNPKYGSVNRIVVCDDAGKPLWDQPEIRETNGTVIVPYFIDGGKYYLGIIMDNSLD